VCDSVQTEPPLLNGEHKNQNCKNIIYMLYNIMTVKTINYKLCQFLQYDGVIKIENLKFSMTENGNIPILYLLVVMVNKKIDIGGK